MTLSEFCQKYRIGGLHNNQDGTAEIVGLRGAVYVYSPTLYGAYITTERGWSRLHKTLLSFGCIPCQDGDFEGSVLFDPSNKSQVRAIKKAVGFTKLLALQN